MKYTKLFQIILILALVLVSAGNSEAASRKLKKNKSVTVKSKHCALEVVTETTSLINVRCVGEKTNKKTPDSNNKNVFLKPNKSVNIKSNNCFLAVQSKAEKNVKVKCLTAAPTATPTATFTPSPTSTPAVTPDAALLLDGNQIVQFAKETPSFPKLTQNLTGIETGDIIVTMDRRPQNGRLYGLGYNSTNGTIRLYHISEETGTASPVGDAPSTYVDEDGLDVRVGFNAGTIIEMDFNPTVDRIRVVTSNGQNFRMNPNTGAVVDGNFGGTTVTGINMDGYINGSTSVLSGNAYVNNRSNAGVTTLYTADNFTKGIFIQNPPNSGRQTGSSILNNSPVSIAGFDIGSDVSVNTNNSAVTAGNAHLLAQFSAGGAQQYCTVNLVDATFGACNQVGSHTSGILGLSINGAPTDVTFIGLRSDGAALLRFRKESLGTVTTQNITGVDSDEVLVGMDFRPLNGQLMALGIDSVADNATLYLIDPQTGTATAVGTPSGISIPTVDFPDPSTTSYALDFNPTVDRIRVITSGGLNLRLNPNNATVAANDVAINGLSAVVNGASYTNSFGGATATSLYTIDSVNSAIYIQNPANNGTQTNKIPLLLSGTPVNFSQFLGFEVQSGAQVSTSNAALVAGTPRSAYAALTSGGVTSLFTIDLASGSLALNGTIGGGNTAIRSLVVSTDNSTY